MKITIAKSKRVADIKSCYCSFPYNQEVVEFFRRLPSRYWHSEGEFEKTWEVPLSKLQSVLEICQGLNWEVEINIPNYQDNRITDLPEGFQFKTNPFDHQMDGILYGLNNESFILGDEQGLGKTKQIIDLALALKAQGKVNRCLIICCVNSLKWNWEKEITKHSNEKCYILGTRWTKRKPYKRYIGGGKEKFEDLQRIPDEFFWIMNIEAIRYLERISIGKRKVKKFLISDKINELAEKGTIGLIAIDEVHKAKNPGSVQGQALLRIENGRRIPMTGTPILNTALDAYVPLKSIGLIKDNYGFFMSKYCVRGGAFNQIVGFKNMEELHELLSGHMLRRLKKDVLNLPPKIYSNDYVEMTEKQEKIYNDVLKKIKEDIDKIKLSKNPLSELIRLRQATGWTGILSTTITESAKIDRAEEIAEEIIESGGKVVFYSQWTQITNPLRDRLARFNSAYMTGEVPEEERFRENKRFQEDPSCKVCIGTSAGMGAGVDLFAGQTLVFLDEPWNRGTKDQIADRVHRIGTTGTVNIITILCRGTIDERINQIVEYKGELADMIVDGKKIDLDSSNLVDFLLS